MAAPLIRVAIVDDHPLVREGTAALLSREPDMQVVATAGSIADFQQQVEQQEVDVVALDIRLGLESGLDLLTTEQSQPGRTGPAVVVVTAYDYPQYVEASLRLGASGFVLKTAPIRELVEAIRRAAGGGLAFGVRPVAGGTRPLSARESDVVRLVVEGHTNDEIGVALGIGAKTVETHLRRLFERHGLQSRTELATRALREGWLELPGKGLAPGSEGGVRGTLG